MEEGKKLAADAQQAHADVTLELSRTKAEVEGWCKGSAELQGIVADNNFASRIVPRFVAFCMLTRSLGMCQTGLQERLVEAGDELIVTRDQGSEGCSDR